MSTKPWDHGGKSRHDRGYGSEWNRLRQTILRRDQHLCQSCLKLGRPTPANQVDHILAKAKGGTDDDTNLQALCKPCHEAKSAEERGFKVAIVTGADGWPYTPSKDKQESATGPSWEMRKHLVLKGASNGLTRTRR
jgi:5-methylcytosine-specific restriction enzyme A